MNVFIAYGFVVIIWATTPLAIKWSNSSLSYVEAITLRTVIAAIVACLIVLILRKPLFARRGDWKPMLIGALQAYPAMLFVYWSAQYIPSGLVSVVFGSTPFFVGVFSVVILRENHFNISRFVAFVIALIGLLVIHLDQMNLSMTAASGVFGIVFSAMLFALTTVFLKKCNGAIEPVRQLAGSLSMAAPCFILTWWYLDGTLPTDVDMKSISGVAYLVIAGSILGGLAFYYVLGKCRVSTVSLIPLMTPVVALVLGFLVEGEEPSFAVICGSVLVLLSLALYQGVLQNMVGYIFKCKREWLRYIRRAIEAA